MSSRYGQDGNKGLRKDQRKYMPKNQNQTTKEPPSPKPTLSSTLRQSLLKTSDSAAASTNTAPSMSRIQMDPIGDWVSGRANGGNFVNYLPQDEAVATGLRSDEGALDPVESQKVVDLLNRELCRLLKLNAKEFWIEVASDTSLHEFLDSFLKFRSRWYDFPHRGANGLVAGIIVGEFELSRHIFMVLYRMSSNRDPGARAADSLSSKDHGVLLQGKKLLDLPKLLDICAIYGHENEDLTRILVENALKSQPSIHENLSPVISHFLGIVSMMHQRCNSALETLFSSTSLEESGYGKLQADFLEVIDFINDAIVSLDSFVTAYRLAAIFFYTVEVSSGNEELICTLARLHDLLLPSLRQGFQIVLFPREDDMMSSIATSLKMLSMRIQSFGWKLLEICYLGDEVFRTDLPVPASMKMFPANVEDPVIRADILIQTLREMNGISQHVPDRQLSGTFLQCMEKNHFIMNRINSLQNSGWILIDDEQFEYLSMILLYTPSSNIKEPSLSKAPMMSYISQVDEDVAMLESKICQIKDLFPEYGSGFLAACLVAYNQNPEEVIQRILEGTLHTDLQSLDTTLETMPMPNSSGNVNRNDKGKGKLIESSTIVYTNLVSQGKELHMEGPSVSSTSAGRYVRKSKDDVPYSETLDDRNRSDSVRTAALISQYEYEDEYDDSFDDLGINIAESVTEDNEDMGQKLSSTMGYSGDSTSESSAQNASDPKWGSRRKPQFYVKDGKNYSYKVAGSVAVSNADEASLVTQAQNELIYGLGRGGNLPLGAVKKLTESYMEQDHQPDVSVGDPRDTVRKTRGRGRKEGGTHGDNSEGQVNKLNVAEVEHGGRGGSSRGRGRRGGHNHYRKDRATSKHFAGLSGR